MGIGKMKGHTPLHCIWCNTFGSSVVQICNAVHYLRNFVLLPRSCSVTPGRLHIIPQELLCSEKGKLSWSCPLSATQPSRHGAT